MLSFIALAIRLAVLGMFWFGVLIVGHFALIGVNSFVSGGSLSGNSSGGMTAMIMAVLLLAGLAFTERIMRLRVSFDDQQMRVGFNKRQHAPLADQSADYVSKRKNNSASGADPMSLLTEDDIDELRAEFKDELRRRYLHGLDEDESTDIASFEALLDNREQRKRR